MGQHPTSDTTFNAATVTADGIPAPTGAANLIDTDYVVGQDNIQGRISIALDIHGKVFSISALSVLLFLLLTLALQNQVAPLFSALRDTLTSQLAWFFLSAGNLFVLLCLGLIISPLGRVRLGGVQAQPDYTYLGWFSMLFAAGMGIGLMFYGVAEPMSHASAAPSGAQSPRRPLSCRSRAPGHGGNHLPLGATSLGHLCHRGPGSGAVFLQQGPAVVDPLDLLPAVG